MKVEIVMTIRVSIDTTDADEISPPALEGWSGQISNGWAVDELDLSEMTAGDKRCPFPWTDGEYIFCCDPKSCELHGVGDDEDD